jgi:hypothetical protein
MVTRHYKKAKNEKKGIREIRELYQIFKGTRNESPEYISKMKRKNARNSNSKFSSVGAATTKQGS